MSTVVFGAICAAAGLIVGWNLLPQPAFIKRLYDKVTGKAA